jgi:hypothetical protein
MVEKLDDGWMEVRAIATINEQISSEVIRNLGQNLADRMADEIKLMIVGDNEKFEELIREVRMELARKIFNSQ